MKYRMERLKISAAAIWLALVFVSGCAEQKVVVKKPGPGLDSGLARMAKKVFASIDPIEVKKKMDKKEDIVILDVRDEREFKKGHLKNAVHIPVFQLKGRLKELDPTKETIVYCQSGFRSRTGSNILVSAGFRKIRYMAGGFQGWSYEVVK